jgi:hypothetical protein
MGGQFVILIAVTEPNCMEEDDWPGRSLPLVGWTLAAVLWSHLLNPILRNISLGNTVGIHRVNSSKLRYYDTVLKVSVRRKAPV